MDLEVMLACALETCTDMALTADGTLAYVGTKGGSLLGRAPKSRRASFRIG